MGKDYNRVQTMLQFNDVGKLEGIADSCPYSRISWTKTAYKSIHRRGGGFVMLRKSIGLPTTTNNGKTPLINWLNKHMCDWNDLTAAELELELIRFRGISFKELINSDNDTLSVEVGRFTYTHVQL